MTQLWAVTIPLGVSGVAIVGTLSGYTAETMGGPERVNRAGFAHVISMRGMTSPKHPGRIMLRAPELWA